MDIYYVAFIKKDDAYYIISKNGVINDFGSEEKGLEFFTGAYTRASMRHVQGNTAAIMSISMFSPKIVSISLDQLSTELFDAEKGIKQMQFDGLLGFQQGMKCNGDTAAINRIYNSGKSPHFSNLKQ